MKNVLVRMPDELREEVGEAAHEGRMSVNALMCEAAATRAQRQRLQSKAIAAVAKAITDGVLQPINGQPCMDCGGPAKVYDHRDYMKPLEVDPVCHACNAARGSAVQEVVPRQPGDAVKTTLQIDDGIWRRARMEAILRSVSVGQIVKEALEAYLGNGMPKAIKPAVTISTAEAQAIWPDKPTQEVVVQKGAAVGASTASVAPKTGCMACGCVTPQYRKGYCRDHNCACHAGIPK